MFMEGTQVEVNGTKYTIEPVLTCDLKALIKILGLKTIFHMASIWKCPYCAVTKLYVCNLSMVKGSNIWRGRTCRQLDKFKIHDWPMHKEEIRVDRYKRLKERNSRRVDMYGIIAEPIVQLPLLNIIPCNLHCIMAILRKLVRSLYTHTHMHT